ncbi:NTP transferase domain-containing protein [Brevibacillus humidisoli]|uniref:nucleotidyltransferase family protein n=1 Tax=Brevibacillus humidisoli TaxID=2895522 RepID=UPI001E3FD057|nr:sugar phosphate nucleotidyltransferase [Brevibacillus humidisoli]UFJ42440.1 NTP transferase domain-containing protein [Brevibacillus humidisoli]
MRAVIMAGGRGVRLLPYTNVLPKPLLPLDGTPILEIILRQLASSGYTRVTVTLHYAARLIRNYFGNGSEWGLAIDYIQEERPLGTAGALRLIDDLDEHFLLMNADVLTDLNFYRLQQTHLDSGAILTALLYERDHSSSFGVVETDSQGRLLAYREKPTERQLISSGIYMLSRKAVAYLTEDRMDVPDLIQVLLKNRQTVSSQVHRGIWMDIGTISQFQQAARFFEQNRRLLLPDERIDASEQSNTAAEAADLPRSGEDSEWTGK